MTNYQTVNTQAKKKIRKKGKSIAYFDYSLLAILICLVCFGLVMLYSTSSYSAMMKQNGDSLYYFKRQLLFCIVGFIKILLFLLYIFDVSGKNTIGKRSKWSKKMDQTSIWSAIAAGRDCKDCNYIIYSGIDLYYGKRDQNIRRNCKSACMGRICGSCCICNYR